MNDDPYSLHLSSGIRDFCISNEIICFPQLTETFHQCDVANFGIYFVNYNLLYRQWYFWTMICLVLKVKQAYYSSSWTKPKGNIFLGLYLTITWPKKLNIFNFFDIDDKNNIFTETGRYHQLFTDLGNERRFILKLNWYFWHKNEKQIDCPV